MTNSIRRCIPLLVMAIALPCSLMRACHGGRCRAGVLRRDARSASARCGGGAATRRSGLLHGAGHGQARHPRSRDRQGRGNCAGSQFGAPWRDRRSGRRPVDHRRRPECDRARRPEDPRRARLGARQGRRVRQHEHARVRREGPRLVHGPDRLLRPARSGDERHQGVEGAARARSLRHRDDPGRRRLLRIARRQPYRAHRHRDRRGDRHRAADPGPGRAARMAGLEGPDLGQLLEHRARRNVRPGRQSPGASGSCRASGRARTRSGSTPATRYGSPSGRPTRSSGSIRSARSSRASRRIATAPTCGRCSAGPPRPGAPNRATTGS